MYSHFQAKPDTLPVFGVWYLNLTMLCDILLPMETELCHLKVTVQFISQRFQCWKYLNRTQMC